METTSQKFRRIRQLVVNASGKKIEIDEENSREPVTSVTSVTEPEPEPEAEHEPTWTLKSFRQLTGLYQQEFCKLMGLSFYQYRELEKALQEENYIDEVTRKKAAHAVKQKEEIQRLKSERKRRKK